MTTYRFFSSKNVPVTTTIQ